MKAVDHTISTILPWRLPEVGRGRRPLTFLDTVAWDVGHDVGYLKGVIFFYRRSPKIIKSVRSSQPWQREHSGCKLRSLQILFQKLVR